MKKANLKRNVIIAIGAIAIVVIASLLGFNAYTNHQQQLAVQASQTFISTTMEKFNTSEDRAEKMQMIIDLEKACNEDKMAKVFDYLQEDYAKNVEQMRIWFAGDYDSTVVKYTIDLNNATKEAIEEAKANLVKTLALIHDEADVSIANEETVKNYETKINDIIASYDAKIVEIIAAEEAAAKAEADRIAAEAAAAAQAEAEKAAAEEAKNNKKNDSKSGESGSSSSNGGSGSSSGGGSSNSGGGGSSGNSSANDGHGRMTHSYTSYEVDENGNKIPGSESTNFFYEDGWAYGEAEGGWYNPRAYD